jgi:hypothetical protein
LKKAISLAYLLFVSAIFLILPIVNAQNPISYVSPEGEMSTHYNLTVYSPNNQTVNNDSVLLNFNVQWLYDMIPVGNYQLQLEYAYSIDDNPFVSIVSNQSANDFHAGGTDITTNPSFSYLLNISNLTNGYHKILIKASFLYAWQYSATYPVYFLVQNPTSNRTPSVPEFPTLILTITLLLTATLLATVMIKRKLSTG